MPVFEMQPVAAVGVPDAAADAAEEEEGLDAREEGEALEDPNEEDEFDDVGTMGEVDAVPAQRSSLPPSLAALPLPASPSSPVLNVASSHAPVGAPSIISIRHKSNTRSGVKRSDSEASNGSSAAASDGEEFSPESVGDDAANGKKKKSRKVVSVGGSEQQGGGSSNTGATGSNGLKRSPSTNATKKKRDSIQVTAAGALAALPPELPAPLSVSGDDSGEAPDTPLSTSPLPPPLPLPPIIGTSRSPSSSSIPKIPPPALPPSTNATTSGRTSPGPIAFGFGAPSGPPPPPPLPPGGFSSYRRGSAVSTDDEYDDEPPPTLGSATGTDDIGNVSFARRTSLAMDGLSSARDSVDSSEPLSPGGSVDANGKPRNNRNLKRRHSSKSPNSGTLTKRKDSPSPASGATSPSTGGSGSSSSPLAHARKSVASSRPHMMDNAIRIVKSMYENDFRASMDSRIFQMEAKEYPENVVYVEEDEEATEDYSLDFPAIKAAAVEKLILALTPEAYVDPDFTFAFLLNFHSFTTPQKLCDLLRCRWTIPLPQRPSKTGVTVDQDTFTKKKLTPIRLRIFNVIKMWLDEHRQALDAEARGVIEKFIAEVIKPDMPGPAATLTKALKESAEDKNEQLMFDEKPPRPYLPMNLKSKLSVLDIHPEELARQITLIDSALYRKIKPSEFLHSGWTKSDKEARSPGILAMINSFNIVSRWVSTQILLQSDLKLRAITLNRVICIAQHCYEYNNFNGVMEIIASLHNSSIHRLYNTWELLPQKSWDMFENLSTLMNSNAGEGNFHLYRNALKKVVPPLVPYLGVYLTDLIFLNDGNKDFVDEAKKMVNFHKMAKIARVVRTIVTDQQAPYCLAPVEFIQDFILRGQLFTDEEQYVESCKLEKKVPKAQRGAQAQNSKGVKKIKVDFKALNIQDDS